MKRSEMIDAIKGDLARMDLDFMHGRNLDKIPYHARIEMVTTYVLSFAERYSMLPPLNDWSLHTDGDKADTDNVRYYTWEPEDE